MERPAAGNNHSGHGGYAGFMDLKKFGGTADEKGGHRKFEEPKERDPSAVSPVIPSTSASRFFPELGTFLVQIRGRDNHSLAIDWYKRLSNMYHDDPSPVILG
jgi:hypothetical protein